MESITCISDIRISIVGPHLLFLLNSCQWTIVLALSKRNSNAAETILFLHRLTQVLVEYFKELEEESIRDNFVIIYELMDEMMDFGYPQTTESKILQECVPRSSL
jgi:AP-1 complex subunit mu